jgi:hypothetical protein
MGGVSFVRVFAAPEGFGQPEGYTAFSRFHIF